MMYTYTGAVDVDQTDLESQGLLTSQPSQQSRVCGRPCGVAALAVGLVLTVSVLASGSWGGLKASVASKVQLQDNSIWKQVLGHKAYEQYEHSTARASKSTESTTAVTTVTAAELPSTTASTSRPPSTQPSTSTQAAAQTPQPQGSQGGLIVSPVSSDANIKQPQGGMTVSPASSDGSETAQSPEVPEIPQRPQQPQQPQEPQQPQKLQKPQIIVHTTPAPAEQVEKISGIAKEFMDEAKKMDPKNPEHKSLENVAHYLTGMMEAKKRMASTTFMPSSAFAAGNISKMPLHSALAPPEALNDGNKCAGDEEEMAGTCYKKCADLTGGYFPIRTSPFSCCQKQPCGFQNTRIHLSFCSDFDVAGDKEGHGCPNFEGACLTDEELFNGLCYKKCSLFPDGAVYNHRVAPNMCCSNHGFSCLLPKYFKFSADFAVGGGLNDGNAQTPSVPHPPMKQLTEVDA